jgi:hypothetical protein
MKLNDTFIAGLIHSTSLGLSIHLAYNESTPPATHDPHFYNGLWAPIGTITSAICLGALSLGNLPTVDKAVATILGLGGLVPFGYEAWLTYQEQSGTQDNVIDVIGIIPDVQAVA